MISAVLREPLVHFLVLSAFILVFSPNNQAAIEDGDSNIVISELDVAHHMQNIDKTMTREQALNRLRSLHYEQRLFLVNQSIENEVLYREALKLGLDESDSVVRQRLIQRMRFMLQGLTAEASISDAELSDYFQRNRHRYQIPPTISFKHRFFKTGNDAEGAQLRAMQALQDGETTSEDAFPYHKAYLDRTEAQIGEHFGAMFAASVMRLSADTKRWQGPLKSEFGFHLVRITSKYDAKMPTLDEVKARVLDDLTRATIKEQEQDAVQKLIAKYTVVKPI